MIYDLPQKRFDGGWWGRWSHRLPQPVLLLLLLLLFFFLLQLWRSSGHIGVDVSTFLDQHNSHAVMLSHNGQGQWCVLVSVSYVKVFYSLGNEKVMMWYRGLIYFQLIWVWYSCNLTNLLHFDTLIDVIFRVTHGFSRWAIHSDLLLQQWLDFHLSITILCTTLNWQWCQSNHADVGHMRPHIHFVCAC